jgi:hypothetical protein
VTQHESVDYYTQVRLAEILTARNFDRNSRIASE